jgi:NNP family nitrate/nitrite transporter-like MFS transporter
MTSFRSQLQPLLFLVWIFFLNFLSRIIFSPLMPAIEEDLKITHGEAGSLFLLVSSGYCAMLLASGFVSSRLNHKKTIILSSLAMGGVLLLVAFSPHLWGIRVGLVTLGLAAGLYLPSGIATVTDLVSPENWGKAIAIHELAPNLAFVTAPFLADVCSQWFSWQGVLVFLGIISLFSGIVFIRFGKGGTSPGEALDVRTLKIITREYSFWTMIVLFSLGIGGTLGIYAMLPLYLVSDRGMEPSWANTFVGLSRVWALGTPMLAGWATDRLGAKRALQIIFFVSGTVTILLGLGPPSWIIPVIFIQAMMAASFFPPAFAALVRMRSSGIKGMTVALIVPVGFLVGGGAIPAGIGAVGDLGSFSLGVAVFGGMILLGAALAGSLRFADD